MAKNIYRSTRISTLNFEHVARQLKGRCIIAIDVAKQNQFLAIADNSGHTIQIVRWIHPTQTRMVVDVLERLRERGLELEVVMEPTGTYSEPLFHLFERERFRTFQIQGKRVHDARELFDSSPSSHDAKAAVLIAHLHALGVSTRWSARTDDERDARAAITELRALGDAFQRATNQLESLLARHWPEVGVLNIQKKVTFLRLLHCHPGPHLIAELSDSEVRKAMPNYKPETLQILLSAGDTLGIPMRESESLMLKNLAGQALELQTRLNEAQSRAIATAQEKMPDTLVKMIGATAAAALLAHGLDPRQSPNAASFQKVLGLNLVEDQSGTSRNRALVISKRGPGYPRRLLYLATLRLIYRDPIVRAWYQKTARRMAGSTRIKAVLATLRKLTRAMWHVARGTSFQAHRLFDCSRLSVDSCQ